MPLSVGLLALGICCYQLSLPHVLFGIHGYTGNGYDDGVYLGAATRLIHGVLPYRDFDFLHPPGLLLLMAPVAAVGQLTGTHDAMGVARCLTALVVGANAALAAIILRRSGTAAMLGAGLVLALFPLAVAADHSLLLEPYLVLFCLLGVLALFEGGQLSRPQRLLLGGAAFGFAGAVKVWAVFPAVAALVACLPHIRRAMTRIAGGILIGFGVPCALFFGAAPRAFVHDVVISQLSRGTSGLDALSIAQRLVMITGLVGLPGIQATTGLAVALSTIVCVIALGVYVIYRTSRFDWFVLVALISVMVEMSLAPEFYDHYAYFPFAFVALLVGVCAGHLAKELRTVASSARTRLRIGRRALKAGWTAGGIVLLGVIGLVVEQDASYASSYLSTAADPGAKVAAAIPVGACVVSDYAILSLDANRFSPTASGCPAFVDPFGMFITRDGGQPPPAGPPFPPAFVALWSEALQRADYVVLSVPYSDYIPWTPTLVAFFKANYVLISSQPRTYVYDHFDRYPTGEAQARLDEGIAAINHDDLRAAASELRAALVIDPADQFSTFDLGVVDQRQGNRAAAEAQYRRSIWLDPRFTSAMLNLALLETPNDPVSATALYQEILAINPGDPVVEYDLGLLLVRTGDVSEGDGLLASAIASSPGLASNLPAGIHVP